MGDWTTVDWSDVEANDIGEVPGHVAQIAYSDKFKQAMGLFRACEARREISPRVLALTRAIIEMNPAHYSVWDYRLEIVQSLGNSVFNYKEVGLTPSSSEEPTIGEDGDWLNQFTLSHAKNYQVWNYRQHIIDAQNPLWYRGEKLLAMMVFDDDAKNFHAWSHLKWVVTQSRAHGVDAFADGSSLLADCDRMLEEDVLNNSVWSFRYFVYTQFPHLLSEKELKYVAECLTKAPSNESVWAYLRGLVSNLLPNHTSEAERIASGYKEEPRAVELLAELSDPGAAIPLWEKLVELEPVRRNFWEWRIAAIQ